MTPMEALRERVSRADASLTSINLRDMDELTRDAVYDLILLLTAAKNVVLDA